MALGLVGLVAVLSLSLNPLSVSSQAGNLLQDPGFEGPYVGRGRGTLNTPQPWNLWVASAPRNYEWQNREDKVFGFPHNGGPEVHGGNASQNLNGGYVTFTAALYQQATVPEGENVTGSAWARLKTCNIAPNADNCGSAVESGAFVRVGIDPNGGTDPNSGSIVWSGNIQPHDRWEQAVVSATVNGTVATLFIYVTQAWPSDLNNVWIDDASLTVGGAGGSAPAAPGAAPATEAPRAVPTAFIAFRQPPQPDGSIIHIVQTGDTLTGISSAYGVPIEEIMELNGLRSSRFIFVGQGLIIQPAGGAEATAEAGSGGTRRAFGRVDLSRDLFTEEQLAQLNPNPGPTPVGMDLGN